MFLRKPGMPGKPTKKVDKVCRFGCRPPLPTGKLGRGRVAEKAHKIRNLAILYPHFFMKFPNITHLILKDTFAVLSIHICRSFLIHVSFRRMIIKGRNMLFGRDIAINLVFSKYLAKIRLKVDLISVPICILYLATQTVMKT